MDSGPIIGAGALQGRRGRARPSRLLAGLCVSYFLAAILFFCVIRYLGDRWWPATVLLFAPRWPWLLPLFVLLPWSLPRKNLRRLTLLTGVFVLFPLMGLSVPWRRLLSRPRGGTPLRLIVCNIHRVELNLPALNAYIVASRPQIVLLQDYSRRQALAALAGPSWHRYQLGEIFIATRYPIRRVHDLHLNRIKGVDDSDLPRRTGSAACFDLQTPAGLVHVVNVHLASPHAGLRTLARNFAKGATQLEANSIRRRNESQTITRWLDTQQGPVIVAGDFNTPAESPIYRQYWEHYSDAFPTAGVGFGYTHFSSLSELRIDHLLSGPGVVCTDCEIGPPCGTPHRPIRADLVIQSEK